MFHYFCQLMYLHYGRSSIINERLPGIIATIERHRPTKVVCFHDECYGTYASYCPAVGIDVPFTPVHFYEYLYDRLTELKELIKPLGIKVAFTPLGIVVAMTFIGLPFVVRTIQPVLEDLDRELEEAAACLGASRWQSFRRVIMPLLLPPLLTGFALAFARAVGEYGSVIFIAGNMPMVSEITPLLIITKLEQYDYAGAAAVATVMLAISFLLLLAINLLQRWCRRFAEN